MSGSSPLRNFSWDTGGWELVSSSTGGDEIVCAHCGASYVSYIYNYLPGKRICQECLFGLNPQLVEDELKTLILSPEWPGEDPRLW